MYFNFELIKHDLCVLVIHVFSGLFILKTYCSYIYFFAVFYFYGFLMESNAIASYSGGTNLYLHMNCANVCTCMCYIFECLWQSMFLIKELCIGLSCIELSNGPLFYLFSFIEDSKLPWWYISAIKNCKHIPVFIKKKK